MAYLKHFPKPLLEDLVLGRWLPVVGAGMSLNARTPPGKKMPVWHQLASALERDMRDFEASNPVDAISAYEERFGRTRLIEQLFSILLVRESAPGDVHREFCSLPFQIVCTTNFDFLLDDQYKLIPRSIDPITSEDQLSLAQPHSVTLLLKLHGDLYHPDRMILTESDYDGFLTKYPLFATYLSNQLITKTAVLIGYSLDDPDFRQIWHMVSQRLGRHRRPAYALMVGASESDIARFRRRGVNVINLPGRKNQYGEILAATFRELREHWLSGVIGASTVKEERPLRELKIPLEGSSRLCFFALPIELLAPYRDKVFPAVEAEGFVPVTADDVISPGDSIAAKIEALIERSTAVVVEPTTPGTISEMYIGVGRLRGDQPAKHRRGAPFKLIIVREAGEQLASDLTGIEVLYRPSNWLDHPEGFINALVDRLRLTMPDGEPSREDEASRLLAAGEYNAAIIAALSHFEATLRQRLDKQAWHEVRRPLSLRSLVDRALEAGQLQPEAHAFVSDWIPLRNRIVHSGGHATRVEATAVVEGVRRLLRE